MSKKLWEASQRLKTNSNLYSFEQFISKRYKKKFNQRYFNILNWSISNSDKFWDSVWDYCNIKGQKGKNKLIKSKVFYKNKFLPKSKLNFSENLLSKNNKNKAITFISENGFREERNWKQLNNNVSKIINFFKKIKLNKKDRIGAYMPNCIETVEGFIATAAIGAIWSSCSPDFGINGVVERFLQIKPKILFITDKYFYNGKEINILERVPKILEKIKSIQYVVFINYPGEKYLPNKYKFKKVNIFSWDKLKKIKSKKIKFSKFDFEKELAILYSSGTTGKPKCICHRSGGVLLQHVKEHQLHCNIKENDNVFYFTTCGWMMWNWLVSVLASKASIVLFDGSPMFKKKDLLLEIVEKEKITLFGVSAKYIDALRKAKVSTKNKYKLKYLKTICSTGSPLSSNGFEYIYKDIKKNIHLSSISGGTDIVSCFVLGNLYEPVISGEIQNKGLGLDIDIFDEKGISIKNSRGELVCKNPFPSMPLKFWNDKNDFKYKKAYFSKYSNIWHHGDYAEMKKKGGFIIYGRSDTTLNPGGVRLGTAEIYSEVDKFIEIKESIVVGQAWDNDIRIILFIVLNKGFKLNEKLLQKIKIQIRKNASPRHVPAKVIVVNDIPRTKNGKIVELAVKNIIEGNKIKNKEALANPEVLKEYKNLKPSATLRINEISKDLESKGKKIFKFGFGQSPFQIPLDIVNELKNNAHQNQYLPMQGLPKLRSSIAKHITNIKKYNYKSENVIIGPGTKELMFLLNILFDGDILLPAPSWVSYEPQAILGRNKTHWIATKRENNWFPTGEEIEKIILKDRSKKYLLFLNSPNNPSGQVCGNLEEISLIAKKYDILILSDEIYSELSFEKKFKSVANYHPEKTIISTGLSKWCGAGGWRLGYFVIPESLNQLRDSLKVLASETFTSVSAPIQYAAIAAYDNDHSEHINNSKNILKAVGEYVYKNLKSNNVIINKPQGGFYLMPEFLNKKFSTSSEMCNSVLKETGVALLPGSDFGFSKDKMIARLSFTDFDGHVFMKNVLDTQNIDDDLIFKFSPNIVEGVNKLKKWSESR